MNRFAPVRIPQTLIAFLQQEIGESHSGKALRKVLEANLCRVNGNIERFGSSQLKKGDRVELSPHWKSALVSVKAPIFTTLYEDEQIRVVDKPAGWICSEENCLRTFPGCFLVHRLDKETTGVLVIAKHSAARDLWMDLFANRHVEKQYLAIVDGIPKETIGVRESYLARKKTFQGQTIWGSSNRGLQAVTHWEHLASGKEASLLLCRPITGRTHQIRVHLAEMGHPILVDRQYAERFRSALFVRRPLLHAFRLSVKDSPSVPPGFFVQAPMPPDIQQAQDLLGIKS